MGKRTRRERRERQRERALAKGDFQALRALAQRSPRPAALRIAGAIASASVDDRAELVELAVALAQDLRVAGDLDEAKTLAAAGAPYAPELAIELVLCAFAAGDDAAVARLGTDHASLAPLTSALFAATSGSVPDPLPKRAAGSLLLRGVHQVAAAVAAAVRGDGPTALAALKRVPGQTRTAVFQREFQEAIRLALAKDTKAARGAALALARSIVMAKSPGLRSALAREVAEHEPALANDLGQRLRLPDDAMTAIALRGLQAGRKSAGPTPSTFAVLRRIGANAFPSADRPAALVHEGFDVLADDPERAARAFHRSIELGGDLLEGLRGHFLAAAAEGGPRCADCGEHHGGAGRDAAAAAERLAHALARRPDGGLLSAAAFELAAAAWLAEGSDEAARSCIEAARRGAPATRAVVLDRLEAQAWMDDDPPRAAGLFDALLERSPDDAGAWRMAITLARRRRDPDRAATLVRAAAVATRDPTFVKEARATLAKEGTLEPFEGLEPGATSAGALAAELVRVTRAGGAQRTLNAAAHACRAALPPKAALAFDAVRLALAADRDAADALFRELVAAWVHEPRALAKLICFATFVRIDESILLPLAGSLVERPATAAASIAFVHAAIALGEAQLASRLLAHTAAYASRRELGELRAELGRIRRGVPPNDAWIGDAEEVCDGLAELLKPEVDLLRLLRDPLTAPLDALSPEGASAASTGDGYDDDGDDGDDYGALLSQIASYCGVPEAAVQRLSPTDRSAFGREFERLAAQPLNAKTDSEFDRLMSLLARALGVAPLEMARRGRRSKKRSASADKGAPR
jgi:hypothetical protein